MAVDLLILFLIGLATAVATGLGAIPVFFLGERAERLRPLLWGAAAGTMGVASVVGLLIPAARVGTAAEVVGGAAAGVAFLVVARAVLSGREVHVGQLRGPG